MTDNNNMLTMQCSNLIFSPTPTTKNKFHGLTPGRYFKIPRRSHLFLQKSRLFPWKRRLFLRRKRLISFHREGVCFYKKRCLFLLKRRLFPRRIHIFSKRRRFYMGKWYYSTEDACFSKKLHVSAENGCMAFTDDRRSRSGPIQAFALKRAGSTCECD